MWDERKVVEMSNGNGCSLMRTIPCNCNQSLNQTRNKHQWRLCITFPKILQFSPRQLQWINGVIEHVMQHVCRQPLPLIVESAFQLDRLIRYQPFDDKVLLGP